MKQFIIGRQGNQPFVIPDSCYHVSGEHSQLTVTDEREWGIAYHPIGAVPTQHIA